MKNELYFSDNFFSAGKTDIYNNQKEIVGSLDLKSAFSSSCDIYNQDGAFVFQGKFRFLSTAWWISDGNQKEVGTVKQRFAFFKKFFEYTRGSEVYSIHSEMMSRDYQILNEQNEIVAEFQRVNSFFESPAYYLVDYTEQVSSEEWIAVVMGVHMIQKRRRSNAAAGGAQ